jgi:hypothetical protein
MVLIRAYTRTATFEVTDTLNRYSLRAAVLALLLRIPFQRRGHDDKK